MKEIKCSIDFCTNTNLNSSGFVKNGKYGINICGKHIHHLERHGEIRKTAFDKNDYIHYDSYVEIVLRDRYGKITGKALIDLENFEKIKSYKFYLCPEGYAKCGVNKSSILLHRIITNAKNNETVDHISQDKLDNRNNNLRLVTSSQNGMNRGLNSNNSSGIKGVYKRKDMNKWMAKIMVNRKSIHLGYFFTIEEATKACQGMVKL